MSGGTDLIVLDKVTVHPLYTVDPLWLWPSLHWLLTLYTNCWHYCIFSTLTVDPLYIYFWPSPHWLLTLSALTVDCWPSLHCLLTLPVLTVDPLYIYCWSSLHSLLTLSTFTVDPLRINCWPSLHSLLTLSAFTVDPLYIRCWLFLHWLLTVDPLYIDCWSAPPGINSIIIDLPQVDTVDCWSTLGSTLFINPPGINSVDHWSALGLHCWSLIHPELTLLIDPSGDQQCQLLIHPRSTLLIIDLPQVDTVDWPPPTDFDFVIFNILMSK